MHSLKYIFFKKYKNKMGKKPRTCYSEKPAEGDESSTNTQSPQEPAARPQRLHHNTAQHLKLTKHADARQGNQAFVLFSPTYTDSQFSLRLVICVGLGHTPLATASSHSASRPKARLLSVPTSQ